RREMASLTSCVSWLFTSIALTSLEVTASIKDMLMATVQWRDQCRSRSASRRFLRLPWLPTLGFVQANALKSLINPNFLGGKQSFIGRTQSFEYRCWRGLRAVRLGCSRSAVCHNRIWNKFERHKDQTRHDNRIIQMSKHRDEIGNDVKRRRKIRD